MEVCFLFSNVYRTLWHAVNRERGYERCEKIIVCIADEGSYYLAIGKTAVCHALTANRNPIQASFKMNGAHDVLYTVSIVPQSCSLHPFNILQPRYRPIRSAYYHGVYVYASTCNL